MRKSSVLVAGALTVAALFTGSGVASADPTPTPTGVAAGYQIVTAYFTVQPGSQAFGSVSCPSGEILVGGGASGTSDTTHELLNSSWPSGHTWNAFMTNSSTQVLTWGVSAVCVRRVPNYQVVTSSAQNPAGTQVTTSARCPRGTAVLGGGSYSTSSSTAATINSLWPENQHVYGVWMNNGSDSDEAVTAYAICGKKFRNYSIVTSDVTAAPAGSEGDARAYCAGTQKELGGGAYTDSTSLLVGLGSSGPLSATTGVYAWLGSLFNNSTAGTFVTAYAICVDTR